MKFFFASLAILVAAVATPAIAADPVCVITFQQNTPVPARSVSVFVNYMGAAGAFPGELTDVECELLSSDVGATSNGINQILAITAQGTPNTIPAGSRVLAECNWIPTSRFPVKGDFDLTIQSAFDGSFPIPQMIASNITISNIDCEGDLGTTTTTTSSTTTSSTTTTTLGPSCGDIDGDGAVRAGDALTVLLAAVGLQVCDDCLCDLDGGGKVQASDALLGLRIAVGQGLVLNCPVCDK